MSLTLAAFSGLGFHLLNRSQHIVYSGPQLRQHSGIPFPGLALSLPPSPAPTLWDLQKHSSSLNLAYVHSNSQFQLKEILYDSLSICTPNKTKIWVKEVCCGFRLWGRWSNRKGKPRFWSLGHCRLETIRWVPDELLAHGSPTLPSIFSV